MFNKNSLTEIISTKVSKLGGHKFGKIVPITKNGSTKIGSTKVSLTKNSSTKNSSINSFSVENYLNNKMAYLSDTWKPRSRILTIS